MEWWVWITRWLLLVFKIKDGYKLELQTHDTMKLFGSTKKIKTKGKKQNKKWSKYTKSWCNWSSFSPV